MGIITHHTRYALNRWQLAGALLPVLVTLAVYLPSLSNGFVNWDDYLYIVDNPLIRSFDLELVRRVFFTFPENFWLPLTWLSFAGDYALWGLDPRGYHLVNLLLHAGNTFLVALLLARLTAAYRAVHPGRNDAIGPDGALCVALLSAGLLFGLHPLRVESVAWVSERKDVLSLFFALPSLLAYLSYTQAPGEERVGPWHSSSYWLSFGLFCCSLASKPMTVTLPLVMLILDWFPLERTAGIRRNTALIGEKLPFLLASLLVGIITLVAQQPAMMTTEDVSPAARAILAGKSAIDYLLSMLWPQGLIPFYVHPGNRVELLSPTYFVPFLVIIVISAFCIHAARKGDRRWLAVWLFYLVTLAPVIGITQSGSQAKADRFTYLPCLGPTLLAASGFGRLFVGSGWFSGYAGMRRSAGATLLLAITVAYIAITVPLISVWRSTETLWSRVIAERPMQVGKAYFERSKYYAERGDYAAALTDMSTSLEIARSKGYTRIYRIYAARAEIYRQMGLTNEAMADTNRAEVEQVAYTGRRSPGEINGTGRSGKPLEALP